MAPDAAWHREQDSPRPQPCCYSIYSRLFHAPWSDPSACTTDDMPWRTFLVISFWSQSFNAVDFSQHVFRRFFFLLKHKGTSLCKFDFIKILYHYLGTHSFLLEGSSLAYYVLLLVLTTLQAMHVCLCLHNITSACEGWMVTTALTNGHGMNKLTLRPTTCKTQVCMPILITVLGISLRVHQWETSLHCNDVFHWLGAYLDWSMQYVTFPVPLLINHIQIYRCLSARLQ